MTFITGNSYTLICFFLKNHRMRSKYVICLDENRPLLFFINTNPSRLYPETQLQVTPSELPFLTHNSFIDTSTPITCTLSKTCKIEKDHGQVPDDIKDKIRHLVRNSDQLPARHIEDILKAF